MAEEDKIIVIGTIEDDEFDHKPFKKVTDIDGGVWKIKQGRGGKLKEKWPLLEEGSAIKLIFGEFTNASGVKFPFVEDFELVKDGLPPSTTPMPPVAVVNDTTPKTPPAPQAVGMTTKEIGDMIRKGAEAGGVTAILSTIFGKETALELVRWYRSQILGTTRILFDGAKLPQFKVEDKAKEE